MITDTGVEQKASSHDLADITTPWLLEPDRFKKIDDYLGESGSSGIVVRFISDWAMEQHHLPRFFTGQAVEDHHMTGFAELFYGVPTFD